jgi:mono/diheme cytochrome c family protein
VVVLFLGTECPVNNLYLSTLTHLQKHYASQGVVFVGINSNAQDDSAAVARHATAAGLPFVVLKDVAAKVADRFAAERTPEAFVLDETRTVRYRGRIDDRYDKGVQRPQATHHDLADAIDAVLAGKTVAQAVTEAAGCPIARPPKRNLQPSETPITYTQQISRLVQAHCQECHRPGEAAPFALMNYSDTAAWSAAIGEAVADRRMPPWHADPAHGHFRNERRLSDADRAALLAWVDQGCPEGDPADLPKPREFVKGWHIGEPDAVFTVPEAIAVPAQAPKGGIPYKFIVATEPFPEEKWIQAVECRPGAPSVVHHITAFLVPPGTDVARWQERMNKGFVLSSYSDDCFLCGYGPGEDALAFPPGQARRIPKGARIAFELHYTPNGTACTDQSRIGMIYAKEPPRQQVLSGSVMEFMLLIPPGAADYRVVASKTFSRPVVLLGLSPHMHTRGKSFTFRLVQPDGRRQTLLAVPRYDFNWQTNYYLAEPIHIAKGAKLECEAHYDNSTANLNNPDPTKPVMWGEQSWQEMMAGFFDYCWDDEPKPGAIGFIQQSLFLAH